MRTILTLATILALGFGGVKGLLAQEKSSNIETPNRTITSFLKEIKSFGDPYATQPDARYMGGYNDGLDRIVEFSYFSNVSEKDMNAYSLEAGPYLFVTMNIKGSRLADKYDKTEIEILDGPNLDGIWDLAVLASWDYLTGIKIVIIDRGHDPDVDAKVDSLYKAVVRSTRFSPDYYKK